MNEFMKLDDQAKDAYISTSNVFLIVISVAIGVVLISWFVGNHIWGDRKR